MAEKAKELGAVIKLGCKVESVDWGKEQARGQEQEEVGVSVSIEGGEEVRGDIVLAADGIWSETRQSLLGKEVRPKPTGDLAYRILLDRESIKDDKLRAWLDSPGINIWVGPEVHAVGYSIKGGRWLNVVLLVKDNLPEDVKLGPCVSNTILLSFTWDINNRVFSLTKFLGHVEKVDKWRLNYRK